MCVSKIDWSWCFVNTSLIISIKVLISNFYFVKEFSFPFKKFSFFLLPQTFGRPNVSKFAIIIGPYLKENFFSQLVHECSFKPRSYFQAIYLKNQFPLKGSFLSLHYPCRDHLLSKNFQNLIFSMLYLKFLSQSFPWLGTWLLPCTSLLKTSTFLKTIALKNLWKHISSR